MSVSLFYFEWLTRSAQIFLLKSSPNHLCRQTVVLCALQFHSLETSCFSHWGLALVSQLLTSTSFGWRWWPVAGLQLYIWPSLPLQSANIGPKLCLLTPGNITLICKAVLCNTGACLFCMAAVLSWVSLFMSVIYLLIFLSVFMKWDFGTLSSPPSLLTWWTLMSYFCFFSHAFLQLYPS